MFEPVKRAHGDYSRTSGHTHDHRVQFYDDPKYLHDTVVDFLADGLKHREPVVVLATRPNREAFATRLAAAGFDLDALTRNGQFRQLDARETLATFMVGNSPDADLFHRSIASALEAAQNGRPAVTIRAYGEMVNLLWQDGLPEAAIKLEEYWNGLSLTHRFSLLCGYTMGNFYKESHSGPFLEICRSHTEVRPAEHIARARDENTRLREIALLQQRARSLEAEIEHRRELEAALRKALAAREEAEAECARLLQLERVARAEAEAAGRVKDEFLAVLSHELRTPLNAILGWAHIANTPGADERTLRRALDVIERNASVQKHVTDDLLDLSRILTGKLLVKTQAVCAAEILMAAVETVRPAAVGRDIDIRVTIQPNLQAVRGDRDRLQQVFWNLLSNAIKFTPEGGAVDVRLEEHDGQTRCSITDTGEGIAADFLPHVFERFRQAETGTTRTHGGLGLGLALVRYLVEAHGGTVTASSDGRGQGATFTVTLPHQV